MSTDLSTDDGCNKELSEGFACLTCMSVSAWCSFILCQGRINRKGMGDKRVPGKMIQWYCKKSVNEIE